MKSFLEYVAEDIITKHGYDLSKVAIVFPNKRASLFINEYLANAADRPIWSPAYYTINELFCSFSELEIGDSIKLICDLHKSFVRFVGESESLDHFYGWGQLLLSDFDDIDKNMADASKVFSNVTDIHELDDLSYLTDRQKKVLKKFFSCFSDDQDSKLKKKFIDLWSHLFDIYQDFRMRLKEQGIAYEGMLFRDVAEENRFGQRYDKYIFVGFNLLQKVEQRMFKRLKDEGRAFFYWDYDNYYLKPNPCNTNFNEAGLNVSQSLSLFPNELDSDEEDLYDNFKKEKNIVFARASSEDIQARYVGLWLNEERVSDGRKTAIVMCDENILSSVVHSLPPTVDKVNVTTGYPLQNALITSFVNQFFMYAIFGGRRLSQHLSMHPYAKLIECEQELELIRKDNPDRQLHVLQELIRIVKAIAAKQHSSFEQESLYKMYTLLNRIKNLTETGDLSVDLVTLQKMLQQLINTTNVPYHGEPAEGIQIMGVLETRNLDFDHVLILSCNEGNMPKGINDSSFIPYSIRKAYGLTTINHKVAVFSYYFHCILQRAHDITILYNNSTEDGHKGEMSRFMLQLMVESRHHIEMKSLQAGQQQTMLIPRPIVKDRNTLDVLNKMAADGFYPTFINRYLRCQLQFYYNHIAGIKEPNNQNEDEIDNRAFGNIFHQAAQFIYEEMMNRSKIIRKEDIENVEKRQETIERAVDKAMLKELPYLSSSDYKLSGLQIINREVIIRYLKRLLAIDKQLAPFYILGLEKFVEDVLIVPASSGEMSVRIGGIIDRLDLITDPSTHEERIRVVDYKTGGKALTVKMNGVDDVFEQPFDPKKHADYYLQTMLYAGIVRRSSTYNEGELPVSPALLFIQHATGKDYDPTLSLAGTKVTDIQTLDDDFLQHIKNVLTEIYNPDKPFSPTTNLSVCATCPYRQLCGV